MLVVSFFPASGLSSPGSLKPSYSRSETPNNSKLSVDISCLWIVQGIRVELFVYGYSGLG